MQMLTLVIQVLCLMTVSVATWVVQVRIVLGVAANAARIDPDDAALSSTCSQKPAAAIRCTATFAALCCHCRGGYLLSASLLGTSQQGKLAKVGTSCCMR